MPFLSGSELNSSWETNGELANARNCQVEQNGWEKWVPNTSTASWSYKALRGSALGPTMAWLRGNNEGHIRGNNNAIRGKGRSRGRGRGRSNHSNPEVTW